MVHLLDADATAPNQALLGLIDNLPAEDQSKIIERLEVDGAPVIVTRFLLEFTTLGAWLAARSPGIPGTAVNPAVPRPADAPAPPVVAAADATQLMSAMPPGGPPPPASRAAVPPPG
ncbi:MAG TPA: hypothetical protein VJN95_04810, partial [Gemmatimonadales bacterium]|nr:hypothetical protein [Gemmatimonadales bacterium]